MERFGVTDDSLSEDDSEGDERKPFRLKIPRSEELQEEVRVSLRPIEQFISEHKAENPFQKLIRSAEADDSDDEDDEDTEDDAFEAVAVEETPAAEQPAESAVQQSAVEGYVDIRGSSAPVPDKPAAASPAAPVSNYQPPSPPRPPSEAASVPSNPEPQRPAPEWARTEAPAAAAPILTPERPTEQVDVAQAEYNAEKRGMRRGLVAGVITGWLLKRHFANKKMKHFQQENQQRFQRQEAEMSRLNAEGNELTRQLSQQSEALARQQLMNQAPAPFAPVGEQPAPKPMSEQLFDAQDQEQPLEVEQQPHVEQSAWHNIVVDEHGREVQGAMNYGEAYRQEHQKEQAPVSTSDQAAEPAMAGAPLSYAPPIQLPDPSTTLPSGQAPLDHTLPAGTPLQQQDPKHLLDPPKNIVLDILKSPNLWLGLLVLVLAYFIATLI